METTNTDSTIGDNSGRELHEVNANRVLPAELDLEQTPSNPAADHHLWGAEKHPETQPKTQDILDNSELTTSTTAASWNPVDQGHVQTSVPPASPMPPMTPWIAATPVPPAAAQRPTEALQRTLEPHDSSYPNNSGGTTATNGSNGSNPPQSNNPPAAKKSGWVKPALIGGLVGALTSGAILGGVLASTKSANNESNKQVAQVSSNTNSPAAAAITPQVGGTKVVPALASSTGQADVPRIVSELSKSIVTINTKGFPSADLFGSSQVPEGAGTGIVLTKDGFVLTNAHVIADAQTIKVTVPGGKTCQADVVGRDRTNDVAVVKCRNVTDFVPAALGKSGEMKVGETVVAIGNALALEGNPTVTTGILSATNRTLEGDGERLTGLLQTDAAINPGNSGGPLVNARGQVVGMNTAIYQNTNNIGFAIPIDSIVPIIEKIRSGEIGKPKTFLGVTTQTMDSVIQKQYSLGTDKGAIVVDVTVGSPAQNAGLQRGDIITKFDGVSITDNKQLGERVRKHKAGDVVDMTYLRGSQSISAKVTLGSALSDV